MFSEFCIQNTISIPRVLFSTETSVTNHGFCDASSKDYAAVVYCRKVSDDGTVSTNIIMAKRKVAPITMVSIPRLELCAEYLLAQTFDYLMPLLAWLSLHTTK